MTFQLRKVAAYALSGVRWVFLTVATACSLVADLAKDWATRLRR